MESNSTKTALITGATSGFGVVIARHLVQKGYGLIVLGRSKEKLNALLADLKGLVPESTVNCIVCDLSSFKSILLACKSVRAQYNAIDMLVLNAGLWNFQLVETEDSIEEILQVNLLAPLLLFQQLHDLIPTDNNSKVIFTSSGFHQGKINFNDIEYRKKFSGFMAYRQSKLGIILLTRLLAATEKYSGISFYAVHPGLVNTNLSRNAGSFSKFFFKQFGKPVEKGALTHIYLIDLPNSELLSGGYYYNRKVAKTTPYSYNLEVATELFRIMENYISKAIGADEYKSIE